MTNRAARKVAAEAGLVIERTLGSAYLSPRIAQFLPYAVAARVERMLARSRLLSRLGGHQMYVARIARTQGRIRKGLPPILGRRVSNHALMANHRR